MKRYGWNDSCDGESGRCRADLILEESGDWVLYSDHHAENVSLRAEVERLTADVERLNALLDVATKMHDRLMDERNKLREELAQTNAMFKQR